MAYGSGQQRFVLAGQNDPAQVRDGLALELNCCCRFSPLPESTAGEVPYCQELPNATKAPWLPRQDPMSFGLDPAHRPQAGGDAVQSLAAPYVLM